MPSLSGEIYEIDYVNIAVPRDQDQEWVRSTGHRIHLLITKDDDGTYSAVALNLPGAASCGDTREEAEANAKEAIRAVLEAYKECGQGIPWKDSTNETIPFGAQHKWIIVDV